MGVKNINTWSLDCIWQAILRSKLCLSLTSCKIVIWTILSAKHPYITCGWNWRGWHALFSPMVFRQAISHSLERCTFLITCCISTESASGIVLRSLAMEKFETTKVEWTTLCSRHRYSCQLSRFVLCHLSSAQCESPRGLAARPGWGHLYLNVHYGQELYCGPSEKTQCITQDMPHWWRTLYGQWKALLSPSGFSSRRQRGRTPLPFPQCFFKLSTCLISQPMTCNEHHALKDRFITHKILDVTEIGATACARHGCFCPGSVVNFAKGESWVTALHLYVLWYTHPRDRQASMDYSVFNAVSNSTIGDIPTMAQFYNVECQHSINFPKCVAPVWYLEYPFEKKIYYSVGAFHISGHVPECFLRYLPQFMPGVGIVDSEVLESLWSTLNEVSPSAQTASLAAWTELLDNHMLDSN